MGASVDSITEEKRRLGAALAASRRRAGLTQGQLALRITYDRTTVVHAERGRQVPAYEFWRACDLVLHANGELVRLHGMWQATKRREAAQRRRDQRTVRASGIAVPTGSRPGEGEARRGLEDDREHPGPTNEAIGSLRSVLDGCRGLDHSIGPEGTLDVVQSQLDVASRLLSMARNQRERELILGQVGELQQLVGWMLFDLGDLDRARSAFDRARTCAEQAGDAMLVAYVLGPSAGFAEIDSGRPQHGVELAYAAQAWARRSGNARLLAFVLAIGARGHAKLGDDRDCRRLLDEAYDVLCSHDAWEADPVWLQVFDHSALLGHHGSCLLDLRCPHDAAEMLGQQQDASPQLFTRNRALWCLDRALAYRDLGDLDAASSAASEAVELTRVTTSARTRKRLTGFLASMAPHSAAPGVRELLGRVTEGAVVP